MGRVDYTKFNRCRLCEINYPKNINRCNICNQALKTKPKRTKYKIIQGFLK